jgi:hypothetical protein
MEMGDKSPKSKDKNKKQAKVEKAKQADKVRKKQDHTTPVSTGRS